MKKYSIIIALFLVVAIFGAVFFVGKNKKEVVVSVLEPITTNVLEPITTNTQTSTTTVPKKEIVSTPGVILIGDRAKYENLSEEGKKIIDRYAEKYPDVYKMQLDGLGNEISAKNTFPLKYYDENTAVIAVPDGKAGSYLNIYDINALNQINDNLNAPLYMFGNTIETDSYIIGASQSHFTYYKKSATKHEVVPGSQLTSKNEWYVKVGGFDSVYDFTFNEPSKTITASVFKVVYSSSSKPNPKLRTETFILP